ncbi:uncharacterized protein [Cherax quadricarinatus]|uniref:uncharacterized protein n=1 Tax=Cherax quadricarinatus TaxID=27406 RepID=UPI00387E39AB
MVAFSNPAAAIEVTNSSMLSIYQPHRSKGSYMLPKSQRFPDEQQPSKQLQQPYQQLQQSYQQLQHQYQQLQQPYPQLQPQRTWTAGPRLDYDDSTTRDPAIPDNPEGLKNPSLLVGPWEEEPTVRITDAVFRGINGSIVSAQAGTTANLPCVIINRADHETVSWIRLRDHHLITVGRQTYSNDDRFSVTYNRHHNVST